MSSEPLGSLDEFFDFARLDDECNAVAFVGDEQELGHGLLPQDTPDFNVDGMDWQPAGLHQSATLETSIPIPLDPGPFDGNGWEVPIFSPNPTPGIPYQADSHFDNAIGHMDMNVQTETTSIPPTTDVSDSSFPIQNDIYDTTVTPAAHDQQQNVAKPDPPREGLSRQASTSSRTTSVRFGSAASARTPASAKRKGPNTRIPLEARQLLEDEFATNAYPCSWEIDIIAHQAGLEAKKVRNWFNNARARKKGTVTEETAADLPDESVHSLATKLSVESLETLELEVERGVISPQPPLAVYLASSYREEAADLAAIQAAINSGPPSSRGDTFMDSSSGSRVARSGSVITSVSSDGSAPTTTYTLSSKGSNVSSFGRDRRRGRRRMTWRNSPYSRAKVNGVDDSGTPMQGLPFFCTFCPRAFKTKYEWIRHEDSVHALRTTWICCNTREDSFQYCPFCGQKHPDEVHMASHKYQQCRNKPETQRTFYRRDHFVQHLHHVHFQNMKHPTARLGCQSKLTASEGHDYGCKDLAMKWRRFGAPMRADDPMLHCGFCGNKAEDWNARCNHVADHLIAGGFDRSTWWSDRQENHLENLCASQAVGPFRCRYCRKVFANAGARDNHTHCRVWSCRFLRTFDDIASENTAPPLCPQFPSPKAHHCHMCGAGYRSSHVEHAQQYHKYRQCKQKLYTSESEFLQHLHEFHGASHPVLLQSNTVLEQHFSRNKGASFEPVEFNELLQGCRVGAPSECFVDPCYFEEQSMSTTSPIDHQEPVFTNAARPITPHRRKSHTKPALVTRKSSSQQSSLSRFRHASISSSLAPKPSNSRGNSNGNSNSNGNRSTSTTVSSNYKAHYDALQKPDSPGPRFFRLEPILPFLSSRIYYIRNAKMSQLFNEGNELLDEMPRGHIASLVMASGLLGMAAARLSVGVKREEGVVEFSLNE